MSLPVDDDGYFDSEVPDLSEVSMRQLRERHDPDFRLFTALLVGKIGPVQAAVANHQTTAERVD